MLLLPKAWEIARRLGLASEHLDDHPRRRLEMQKSAGCRTFGLWVYRLVFRLIFCVDTLYTFWDNTTHSKNKSVHFLGLMNAATKQGWGV